MSMGILLRNSFLGTELGPWCALAAGSLSGSAGAVELVNFAEVVDCLCCSIGAGS